MVTTQPPQFSLCHAERSEASRNMSERPCEILRFAQHDSL